MKLNKLYIDKKFKEWILDILIDKEEDFYRASTDLALESFNIRLGAEANASINITLEEFKALKEEHKDYIKRLYKEIRSIKL